MINELAQKIHDNAKSKGFYDNKKNIGEMLCLIHSEVSEALEADRKNHHTILKENWYLKGLADPNYGASFNSQESFKHEFEKSVKNTFEDELADVMIRVMDLAAYLDIDLESHIKAKMRYNASREHKHGKAY
jgi:NTP pyrophosphatase (non-canonical NTP hydrolase)